MFLPIFKHRSFIPGGKAVWDRKLARFPIGKRLFHIVCSEIDSPEFINLDARPLSHVYIVNRNLRRPRRIPDAALDVVYTRHVLEHLLRVKTLRATAQQTIRCITCTTISPHAVARHTARWATRPGRSTIIAPCLHAFERH